MLGKSIYIAGPMTGYPEFNFPAFFTAQYTLEKQGWKVWNPANKDEEAGVVGGAGWEKGDDQALMKSGWDFKEAFTWDLDKVVNSDGIYLLPGWEKSSGARAEHAAAVAIQARYPEYKIIYG
jgi:hypothetical protein